MTSLSVWPWPPSGPPSAIAGRAQQISRRGRRTQQGEEACPQSMPQHNGRWLGRSSGVVGKMAPPPPRRCRSDSVRMTATLTRPRCVAAAPFSSRPLQGPPKLSFIPPRSVRLSPRSHHAAFEDVQGNSVAASPLVGRWVRTAASFRARSPDTGARSAPSGFWSNMSCCGWKNCEVSAAAARSAAYRDREAGSHVPPSPVRHHARSTVATTFPGSPGRRG